MEKISSFIEEKYRYFVFFFFAIYLLLGICIFRDFGISWDENMSQNYGEVSLKYAFLGNKDLLSYSERNYGPFVEMILVGMEYSLGILGNPQAVFFMRHLMNFMIFYAGLIFFYLLCRQRFKSWKLALLGSLFLILSPRIFADSFYNSKDIPFLSIFTISIYTLIMYLNKKTLLRALIHALICAFLIDVRIVGVIIPFFTIIFFLIDLVADRHRTSDFNRIGSLFLFLAATFAFCVLFWPTLWSNPFQNFVRAFKAMSHFQWNWTVLYMGNYIKAQNLPWHYIPVWILISTPLTYIFLCLIGCVSIFSGFIKGIMQFYLNRKDDLVFFSCLIIPPLVTILLRSHSYDAWRHMFFIYAPFLIIAIMGLETLFKLIENNYLGSQTKILKYIVVSMLVLSLTNTIWFMVRNHPHQNVYFNVLAGKNMETIKKNFELDYWGLSYRQALEYILKNDKGKSIKIFASNQPGVDNSFILPTAERQRLVHVSSPREAKYSLSNYRWHKEEYPSEDEFYSIIVDGAKIMVVLTSGSKGIEEFRK